MRSVQFRNGLKRILHHERHEQPLTPRDAEVTALLHSLCNVVVVLVRELESQYVLKATGEDITQQSQGSNRLVVLSSNSATVYLAPPNQVTRHVLLSRHLLSLTSRSCSHFECPFSAKLSTIIYFALFGIFNLYKLCSRVLWTKLKNFSRFITSLFLRAAFLITLECQSQVMKKRDSKLLTTLDS